MKGYRFDPVALARKDQDPYLVVSRMLREQYGPIVISFDWPIDWWAPAGDDLQIRALVRQGRRRSDARSGPNRALPPS